MFNGCIRLLVGTFAFLLKAGREQNPRLGHPILRVSMTISRRDYKEFSI
jgi:hypothetical protein